VAIGTSALYPHPLIPQISGSKVGHRATFGGVLMRYAFQRLYSFEKKFTKQKPTASFSKN
jgi:hypothetical protein